MQLKTDYRINTIRTSRQFERDTAITIAHAKTNQGDITYAKTPYGLCWLGFGDNTDVIQKRFRGAQIEHSNFELGQSIALDLYGTDFQISVWKALLKIPSGQTVTYSDIANDIKNPKAVRAVGSAIGENPISVIIPCHRVIRTDGGAGGYLWGIETKRKILSGEQVYI